MNRDLVKKMDDRAPFVEEISRLRRAVWELYDECKKRGMHDNTMSTETANVVAEVADVI